MKRRLEFTVTPETAGKTVRRFLQEELSFSGHQISRLKFQEEGIRVDGKKVYVSHVLREGEVLTVGLTEQVLRRDTEGGRPGKIWEAPAPELSKYPLQVLYEDSDLLIVNKPAGMVCHPSPGHFSDTLANQAAAHLGGYAGDRKTGQRHLGHCDFCPEFGSGGDDPKAKGGRKTRQDLSGAGGRKIRTAGGDS